MCMDERNINTREGFVSLAIEKRVRNKRRRDPDMHLDVLLSSTVKRLKCEIVNERYGHNKGKREKSRCPTEEHSQSSMETIQEISSESHELNEVEKAVECLQFTLENLDDEIRSESNCPSTSATSLISSTGFSPKNVKETVKTSSDSLQARTADSSEVIYNQTSLSGTLKEEDVDFDTLMQSLLEICEPLVDVDDLIKEYSIDPLSSGPFDVLNSNDPFLPGMFEVMCS